MKIFKTFLKKIIQIFFPATCFYCQKIISYDGLFCKECFSKIKFISPIKCKICSLPFRKQQFFSKQSVCINCLTKKPFFDETHVIYVYNYIIGQAILDLKFKDKTYIAYKIANFMKINFKNVIEENDYIISVPMHYKRLRNRKFNHANLIARNISSKKYLINLLLRLKNNPAQLGLKRNKRKKNLRKTFVVNPKYLDQIKDKKILLIDDVMTTGTTLNYCAKALKKAKVKKVSVIVFAKTLEKSYRYIKGYNLDK